MDGVLQRVSLMKDFQFFFCESSVELRCVLIFRLRLREKLMVDIGKLIENFVYSSGLHWLNILPGYNLLNKVYFQLSHEVKYLQTNNPRQFMHSHECAICNLICSCAFMNLMRQ